MEIPRLPFSRLAREIVHKFFPNIRIGKWAMEALQEGVEMCTIFLIENANMITVHRKRKTLSHNDLLLAMAVWGDFY